jgi:monothiol glutaredoxin
MSIDEQTRGRIDALVRAHRILLFMKGERHAPQCGFSAAVVQVLNALGCDYHTVDVLADPQLREGIKAYANWPTIPQLYASGEFQGGCDIVCEAYARGELQRMLGLPQAGARA